MWDSTRDMGSVNDKVAPRAKKEEGVEIPWFVAPLFKKTYEPFFGYFSDTLDTKSGKPWWSK